MASMGVMAMTHYNVKTLRALFAALSQNKRFVAPTRNAKNKLIFNETTPEEMCFDDILPLRSSKDFLFLQTEALYYMDSDGAHLCEPNEALVLAGVRPCDLRGLALLRAVFLRGPGEDAVFANRLEHCLLIGIGCRAPHTNCFCEELGQRCDFSADCDLFFQPTDDEHFCLVHQSEKGIAALRALGEEGCDVAQAPPACVSLANPLAHLPEIEEQLMFSVLDWQTRSEACLACGFCAQVCPCCHCFGTRDAMQQPGVTVRYRQWEHCMAPVFTRHASGHNPRDALYRRFRQRVLHKFYYLPKNTGLLGCTGCGRCLRHCPAGLNMHTIACALMEVRP